MIKILQKTLENHHTKLFFFLALAGFINLYLSFLTNFFYANGDSAVVVDLVNNLGVYNKFRTMFAESLYHLRPYLSANVEQYCSLNLHNPNEIPDFIRQEHSYFIAIILSLFVKLGINSLNVVSFFFAANFILIFITIFFFLKEKINYSLLYLFILAIMIWPPISVGFVGQFYFDRLYIFPMFCLILAYYSFSNSEKKSLFLLILVLGFYTSLVHERAALMVGLFLCGYSLLITNFKVYKNKKILLIFFYGLIALSYFIFYTKFYINSSTSHYSSSFNIDTILYVIKNIFSPYYGPLSVKLFIINLPILLMGFFDKRLFFLAICSILPNYMITIGGAEKNALTTHYHSYYIPFLIASSVVGFKNLYEKKFFANKKKFLYIFLISLIVFNNTHDYGNTKKIISFKELAPGLKKFYSSILYPFDHERRNFFKKNIFEVRQSIKKSIPYGSSVDMDESMMPYFASENYKVKYFPVGIGSSQYLIVPFKPDNDKDKYKMIFPSFRTIKENKEIEICLTNKINNSYNKVNEFIVWGKRKYILYVLK